MSDHEQIRRDVTRYWMGPAESDPQGVETLARHCLTLLTELEQAEGEARGSTWLYWRERAETAEARLEQAERERALAIARTEAAEAATIRLLQAEARLAKVPPLVEAAQDAYRGQCDEPGINPMERLGEALRAWEQQ